MNSTKPRKTSNIFQKSNYIVVVAQNVLGFETEVEVIEFLKTSQILGGVKLFVNTPVKVECSIQIGEKK